MPGHGRHLVYLRLCMICGHVGSCDQSKNKHATAHPIIRSFEPGDDWGGCSGDEVGLDASRWPIRGPVAHSV
jgi:hypothetical protein